MAGVEGIKSNAAVDSLKVIAKEKELEIINEADKASIFTEKVKPEEVKVEETKETTDKGEKVSFGEGAKLVGKGFLNKVKDIGKAIVKHPLKTLAVVGVTTAAIMALPLIGISAAAGAAALAIGFGAVAVGKTVAHTAQAIKHSKNGEHNEVREDLQKIGGDGVDLALSLPFVPKGIKTVGREIKYGARSAERTAMLSEARGYMKEGKGLGGKIEGLRKGNLRVQHEIIGNEMGIAVKPQLVFDKNMPITTAAEFEPIKAQMRFNTSTLKPLYSLKLKKLTKMAGGELNAKSWNPESLLRHEMQHVRQFINPAKTEGIGVHGVTQTIEEYSSTIKPMYDRHLPEINSQIKQIKGIENPTFAQKIQQKVALKQLEKGQKFYERNIENFNQVAENPAKAINTKYYKQAAAAEKPIKAGTAQAAKSEEYLFAFKDKINGVILGENYGANLLEQEAFVAQDLYFSNVLKRRSHAGWGVAQAHSATTNTTN